MSHEHHPGRIALVTGGAGGLGAGVAVSLAERGFRVTFTYLPGGTSPEETLERIRRYDAGTSAIAADASDPASAAQVVEAMRAGRGVPEIAVHMVGPIVVRRFAKSTLDDYAAMVDGNLRSAVALAFAVLPPMRAAGFGRLVFFGMNGSATTVPGLGMSLYGAAKAGVVTFARALALEEAARGITVNVVEPGDIRDKRADRAAAAKIAAANPTGHAGSWEDIGNAVSFLVSDGAGFINGATVGVNGGLVGPYEAGSTH